MQTVLRPLPLATSVVTQSSLPTPRDFTWTRGKGGHRSCFDRPPSGSPQESVRPKIPIFWSFPFRSGGWQNRHMESPSEILHTWRRLLLTASILYCQIQLSSAARAPVRIVPNPSYGTVGSNITLAIEGFSGNVFSYTWYRKSVEIHNQIGVLSVRSRKARPHIRERVLSDGSLIISNLTLSDIGDYIIQIVDSTTGVIETAQIHLSVYDVLSKPTIVSTNVAPVENKDTVSLTCQTLSQDVKFHWITPKGPPLGYRIKLSPDKRKLTIIKVSREDQGRYQCRIQNQVSENVSEQFMLTVAAKSPEQSRGSSLFGRTSAVIVTGVLTGGILIRCLI